MFFLSLCSKYLTWLLVTGWYYKFRMKLYNYSYPSSEPFLTEKFKLAVLAHRRHYKTMVRTEYHKIVCVLLRPPEPVFFPVEINDFKFLIRSNKKNGGSCLTSFRKFRRPSLGPTENHKIGKIKQKWSSPVPATFSSSHLLLFCFL